MLPITTNPPSTVPSCTPSPSISEGECPKLNRRVTLPPSKRLDPSPTPSNQPSPPAPVKQSTNTPKSKPQKSGSISRKKIRKTSHRLRSDVDHWTEYYESKTLPDGREVYACKFCTKTYLIFAKENTIQAHTYTCPGNKAPNV
uniref:BED-type domain-containing protein n=1 Tax=Panagrellus redivivus TaxID=6233 RepID=A0A7E4VU91_PANRE